MESKQKYTCLIVDDESLARQLLQVHLLNHPRFELIHSFSSAEKALEYLKDNEIDLLFLDIEMQGISGLELIPKIQQSIKVILSTAYAEFALDAFELNVVDYMVKPITIQRFNQAIERVFVQLETEYEAKLYQANFTQDNFITIKSSYSLIQVPLQDIIYIEAMHKYIKIFTIEKRYTTLMSLTTILEMLPNNFFRCHRSFVVNLNTIDQIQGSIICSGTYEIPVSRTYKAALMDKIK
jgi:DNA-binding LytR/AlgR family response regulator